MNKRKTGLLLLLALLICLSIVGCEGANEAANNQETQEQPSEQANEQADAGSDNNVTDEPAEDANAEAVALFEPTTTFDLQGREFVIAGFAEAGPNDGSERGRQLLARHKAVEEKYNTKIVYKSYPWAELKERFAAAGLSGETLGDIVRLEIPWAIPTLAGAGLLQSLDELLGDELNKLPMYTAIPENEVAFFKQVGSFNGHTYGFLDNEVGGSGVYYNKTLFKNLGLTDLHELVDQDNWNWSTFLEIAKQATRDTNGDGVSDTFGISGASDQLANGFIASNNANYVNAEGKVVLDTPEAIEALTFFAALYNEHRIVAVNPEAPQDWTAARNYFVEGKVAMTIGETWEASNRIADMGDQDWGYVPFPKGPKSTDYVSPRSYMSAYFIPKGGADAEAAIHIYNDLILWDKREEGYAYEIMFLDEKDMATAEKLRTLNVLMPYNAFPGFPIWDLLGPIVTGDETVTAAIDKVKADAQAQVDLAYNK